MNNRAELFQAFFDTSEDAIFVVDAQAHSIADANARAIRDSGYSREELESTTLEHLLQRHNGAVFSLPSEHEWERIGPVGYALSLVRKTGEGVPVHVKACWFTCNRTSYVMLVCKDTSNTEAPAQTGTWEREDFPTIIGRSRTIHEVCRLIGSLKATDVTVLILGETGTGKEVVANAIHAHSRRYRGPFVKVNCAALTETLLESELFGHVKGAFTGATHDRRGRFKQADGGTIFLDEIGSMSPAGQAKLLRVLQEREFEPVGSSVTIPVDVRVIAATNADLMRAVAEGKFREDLYYRLNVFLLSLPPLRERKEDVALLAEHFLQHYNRLVGKTIRGFAPEALGWLLAHDWPGNVRELGNSIEHSVIVESGTLVQAGSLPANLTKSAGAGQETLISAELSLRDKLNVLEKQILIEALARANWIKKRAADLLGIDPRNLPYLLRKHHLDEKHAPVPLRNHSSPRTHYALPNID
jgi:PAS domain S-box-containing protein